MGIWRCNGYLEVEEASSGDLEAGSYNSYDNPFQVPFQIQVPPSQVVHKF